MTRYTRCKRYVIWTGDGGAYDGCITGTFVAAKRAVRERYGWRRVHLVEHCDGGAWSCYPTRAAAAADEDGAYAPSITRQRRASAWGEWTR